MWNTAQGASVFPCGNSSLSQAESPTNAAQIPIYFQLICITISFPAYFGIIFSSSFHDGSLSRYHFPQPIPDPSKHSCVAGQSRYTRCHAVRFPASHSASSHNTQNRYEIRSVGRRRRRRKEIVIFPVKVHLSVHQSLLQRLQFLDGRHIPYNFIVVNLLISIPVTVLVNNIAQSHVRKG